MVYLLPYKALSNGFNLLLALFWMSSTCMWLNPINTRHAQLGCALAWDQEPACSHSSETPATDRLSSRGVHTTTSHWFTQGMLFDIEEDWDTFLSLIPTRMLSNLFQFQSRVDVPLAPHQSYRARKLYLHHLSFLC